MTGAHQTLRVPSQHRHSNKRICARRLRAQVQTIEPVVAVARAAKARGMPIAVASGGSTSNVRTGLASTGILHLFDAVVCAEVRTHDRPKLTMEHSCNACECDCTGLASVASQACFVVVMVCVVCLVYCSLA